MGDHVEKPEHASAAAHEAKPDTPTGVIDSSDSGLNGPFPAELKGWNWGAFFLTWIWGLAHNAWITLTVLFVGFIPLIGPLIALGLAIYLGVKGNELAWTNRKFKDLDEFNAVQKAWATWGVAICVVSFVLGFALVYFGVFSGMRLGS